MAANHDGMQTVANQIFAMGVQSLAKVDSNSQELEGGQDGALAAILFSAFSLEARTNEVVAEILMRGAYDSGCGTFYTCFEALGGDRRSTKDRITALGSWIGARAIGSPGWLEDLDILFKVRDQIVHPKPVLTKLATNSDGVMFNEQVGPQKVLRQFLDRYGAPAVDGYHAFHHRVATRVAGRWACNVVANVAKGMLDLTPENHVLRFMTVGFEASVKRHILVYLP